MESPVSSQFRLESTHLRATTDTSLIGTDTTLIGTDTALIGTETALIVTDTPLKGIDTTLKGTDTAPIGTDTQSWAAFLVDFACLCSHLSNCWANAVLNGQQLLLFTFLTV